MLYPTESCLWVVSTIGLVKQNLGVRLTENKEHECLLALMLFFYVVNSVLRQQPKGGSHECGFRFGFLLFIRYLAVEMWSWRGSLSYHYFQCSLRYLHFSRWFFVVLLFYFQKRGFNLNLLSLLNVINNHNMIFKTINRITNKHKRRMENSFIKIKSEKFTPYHVHEKIILTDEYQEIYNSFVNGNICEKF